MVGQYALKSCIYRGKAHNWYLGKYFKYNVRSDQLSITWNIFNCAIGNVNFNVKLVVRC